MGIRILDIALGLGKSVSDTCGCSSFSISAEKELAEVPPVRILQAASFYLLATFLYCLSALTDRWPVNSFLEHQTEKVQ